MKFLYSTHTKDVKKSDGIKYYEADLSKEGWEAVRELAEDFIVKGYFEGDPVKAVVNAYTTLTCLEVELSQRGPSEQIH